MRRYCFISLVVFSSLAVSCITSRKLTYMERETTISDTAAVLSDYLIQPFDNLYIRVSTPDPKWSEMFNTLETSASTGTLSELSADIISYSVDIYGNIELPYAGKFKVSGKTMASVREEILATLRLYVSDASVSVRMINNYISIIGEVKNPGRYPVYKDRLNIFQALAMAGDIGDYGNRQKVKIIRQGDTGPFVREFSLRDNSVLSSEYFYVMPNDVIYVMPLKGRFFQMNAFPYASIIGVISTFILFLNVLK